MRRRLRNVRTVNSLVKAYESGFEGVFADPEQEEKFNDEMQWASASDAAHAFGLADSAKGKLSIPFKCIEMLWPEAMPGPAQRRGDCVSHSTKNAQLLTLACEIVAGKPDEDTGIIEGPPAVSEVGERNGVLSTEAIYWWRDHGGDGWGCHHASRVAVNESGMWVRKDYRPDFGFDLTKYSASLAGKWGRTSPPDTVKQEGMKHAIKQATSCGSFEEVRDMIANGYGISTCGGEGWSSKKDVYGFSKRSGSWSHAMAIIAVDDRQIAHDTWGEPVVCILNSWGSGWNSGGRKIIGTNIEIPKGAFWSRWSDAKRRSFIALSGAEGWPPQKLPDWGSNYWSRL